MKQAKLQTYRIHFESLKMKDEEQIAEYLLRVDEIVNAVVQKILRSLPSKYNAKIFAIEEARDLKTLTIDDLHGMLTAYKMRTFDEETTKRETTFKSTNKIKKKPWDQTLTRMKNWQIW